MMTDYDAMHELYYGTYTPPTPPPQPPRPPTLAERYQAVLEERNNLSDYNYLQRMGRESWEAAEAAAKAAGRPSSGTTLKDHQESFINNASKRTAELARQSRELRDEMRRLAPNKDKDEDGKLIEGSPTWARIRAAEDRERSLNLRSDAAIARARSSVAYEAHWEAAQAIRERMANRQDFLAELNAQYKDATIAQRAYDLWMKNAEKEADDLWRIHTSERQSANDYAQKEMNLYRAQVALYGKGITKYGLDMAAYTSERNKDVDKISKAAAEGWDAAMKMAEKLVSPAQAEAMVKQIREYGKKIGIAELANYRLGPAPGAQNAPPSGPPEAPTADDYAQVGGDRDTGFSGAPAAVGPYKGAGTSNTDPYGISAAIVNPNQNWMFNPQMRQDMQAQAMANTIDRFRPMHWQSRDQILQPGLNMPYAPEAPVISGPGPTFQGGYTRPPQPVPGMSRQEHEEKYGGPWDNQPVVDFSDTEGTGVDYGLLNMAMQDLNQNGVDDREEQGAGFSPRGY